VPSPHQQTNSCRRRPPTRSPLRHPSRIGRGGGRSAAAAAAGTVTAGTDTVATAAAVFVVACRVKRGRRGKKKGRRALLPFRYGAPKQKASSRTWVAAAKPTPSLSTSTTKTVYTQSTAPAYTHTCARRHFCWIHHHCRTPVIGVVLAVKAVAP